MDFRDATAADAPLLAAMHAQSWRSAYAGLYDAAWLADGVEADRLAVWTQRFSPAPANQRVIIASADGAPLGFICLWGDDDPRWGTIVENLHVLPAAKGKGLGKALLGEAARWSLADYPAAKGLYLRVYVGNAAARAVYAHLGGQVVQEQEELSPDGSRLMEYWVHWPDARVLL